MRLSQRAIAVIAVMIGGLVPATAAAAATHAVRAADSAIKVKATINVGTFATDAAVDPLTGTIYVTNVQTGTISVVNGHTNKVTATIAPRPRRPGSPSTR